jgi:hypothetical protein
LESLQEVLLSLGAALYRRTTPPAKSTLPPSYSNHTMGNDATVIGDNQDTVITDYEAVD